jgi:four helix bundle protein
MPLAFEDMRVLQNSEAIADDCWKLVLGWPSFARDAMGKMLIQAADSIGANVAEAFGRYHDGEKLRFLYYARGSLFETKYWLNRAVARELVTDQVLRGAVEQLSHVARQLNALVASTRQQRSTSSAQAKAVRENAEPYGPPDHWPEELFSDPELTWLSTLTPMTNY